MVSSYTSRTFSRRVSSREEEEEGEFVRWGKKGTKKNLYLACSRAFDLSSGKLTEIQYDAKRSKATKRERRTNASKTLLFPLD